MVVTPCGNFMFLYFTTCLYIKQVMLRLGIRRYKLIDRLRCHIRIKCRVFRREYHVEHKHDDWLLFSSLLNDCLYLKCFDKIWMLMLNFGFNINMFLEVKLNFLVLILKSFNWPVGIGWIARNTIDECDIDSLHVFVLDNAMRFLCMLIMCNLLSISLKNVSNLREDQLGEKCTS